MSSIVIPNTQYRLEIQDGTEMYLRGVEVFIGVVGMGLHHCEKRYQPLFVGGEEQPMSEVNALRIMDAAIIMDRWLVDANRLTLHLVQYRLHLAPEIQGWHTMFEVQVDLTKTKRVPELVVPDPTGPKIALEKKLSIVSIL